MPPALRLLLRLRLIALGRSIKKMLSTVRGKIVAVGLFAIVLLLMLRISDMNAGSSVRALFDPVTLRKQASLGLFVMLFFVFIKSKKNGVVFSPDEVEHLFSAPFSRRQLLMFKLVTNLSQVVASMFLCIFAYARFTPDFLCASIGVFLSFTFMNYASIFVGLFGQVSAKIAARSYRVTIGVTLFLLLIISPFMFFIIERTANRIPGYRLEIFNPNCRFHHRSNSSCSTRCVHEHYLCRWPRFFSHALGWHRYASNRMCGCRDSLVGCQFP